MRVLCEFELLVAEVGDELEGAAECGDEPAEHFLGGDVCPAPMRVTMPILLVADAPTARAQDLEAA